MWMLDYRSRFFNSSWSELPKSLFLRSKLKILMNQHNYDQIQSYTDRYEPKVYLELRRIQNTIYWSLDDYFVYDFKGKTLDQIICQDMGLYKQLELAEQETQNVEKIKEYITKQMQNLQKTPLKELQTFKWQL